MNIFCKYIFPFSCKELISMLARLGRILIDFTFTNRDAGSTILRQSRNCSWQSSPSNRVASSVATAAGFFSGWAVVILPLFAWIQLAQHQRLNHDICVGSKVISMHGSWYIDGTAGKFGATQYLLFCFSISIWLTLSKDVSMNAQNYTRIKGHCNNVWVNGNRLIRGSHQVYVI